jgi:hypothetical protein
MISRKRKTDECFPYFAGISLMEQGNVLSAVLPLCHFVLVFEF